MLKWIETTGRSEEDAIAAALFQLGLDRDDVSVEVIERAKSGFLGFGGNPAKVRVSYEVADEETPVVPEKKEEVVEVKPVVEEKPVVEAAPAPAKKAETILIAAPKAKKPEPKSEVKSAPKAAAKAEAKLQPEDEVIIAQEPAASDDAKAERIREFLGGLIHIINHDRDPP